MDINADTESYYSYTGIHMSYYSQLQIPWSKKWAQADKSRDTHPHLEDWWQGWKLVHEWRLGFGGDGKVFLVGRFWGVGLAIGRADQAPFGVVVCQALVDVVDKQVMDGFWGMNDGEE